MHISSKHVSFDHLTDVAVQYFLQMSLCLCRSHAKLERALDWLLAIYKVALPILVS